MRLPWGKHKGEDIEDVPSDYLRWLAENCEQDYIATAADEEWQWREDNNAHKWDRWEE
jgi:hypothetical protein